jgi:GNAT superfamily N-acetyltransferase
MLHQLITDAEPALGRQANDRRLDIPIVLLMIRELAGYAGLLDEVQATDEMLFRTLCLDSDESSIDSAPVATSPGRPARCLLLFNTDGVAVGFAVYFYNYSTWTGRPGIYLEDLFVRQHERGNGYGTRLLVEVAKRVVEIEGTRLDWNVLKWNERAINFCKSLRAKTIDGWTGMRLEGEAVGNAAAMLN